MQREFETEAEKRAYNLGTIDGEQAVREQAENDDKLTLERIKGMTAEQLAPRMDEVNAVLAAAGDDNG
ncbi:MAG TPA: hypothetical protein VGY13_10255 [Solirubrobacteraceae bacterium]|jgi:hypothetical protein|nr:hypothetical protein [Solirubrobacteraceae bacterium]